MQAKVRQTNQTEQTGGCIFAMGTLTRIGQHLLLKLLLMDFIVCYSRRPKGAILP
ncbi:hypothetical protein JMUB5695_03623 [Mycobacterium heckeshornense]|nr:hypothetical protein JMUB5695_03623 [Mycobacterium heckeshornense]